MQIIGVLFAGLCFATWNAAAPYGPSKDQSSSPQSRGSCTVTGAPACSTGYRRKREPRLTCNFNSMPNSSSTAAAFNRLPMCHEVFQPGLPWINAAYHRYQFVRTDQSTDDIHEGEAALKSNCTRNIVNYSNPSLSQMLIRPEEASASLQSGIIEFPFGDPSNRCARFFVSFWYRLNGRVVVADRTNPNRFYLEVLLHRVNEDGATGRPGRTVWGSNIADFALAAPNNWTRAQFDFTESDNFSLNFFAHHNDNCNEGTVRPIYLDLVETESELKECVPTIPPVPTISTIPTASPSPNVPSSSTVSSDTTVSGVPSSSTISSVPDVPSSSTISSVPDVPSSSTVSSDTTVSGVPSSSTISFVPDVPSSSTDSSDTTVSAVSSVSTDPSISTASSDPLTISSVPTVSTVPSVQTVSPIPTVPSSDWTEPMKSSPAPTVFTAETELPSSPAASSRPREEFVPDKPVWLYILGGCLGGAVVIGIALLSCYCIQRRRRARLTKLANSKVQRPAVAMMRRPENHYLPNRPVPVRSTLPPPPEPEPDYMDLAELRRDVNYRRDTTALARNGQRTAENFSGRNQYGMAHSLHHEEHQRGPAAPSARIYGRASGMERGEIYGRNRASRRDYLD